MTHVITQSCCGDASCVYACPVNCIQPAPGEPGFATAEMLHIDPYACVDCGACVGACPVGAIVPERKLTLEQQRFRQINHDYFDQTDRSGHVVTAAAGRSIVARPLPVTPIAISSSQLRVAIVGSGPAAMYAVEDLLKRPGITIDIYERLALPYGLARFGIAPDHTLTRHVTRLFDHIMSNSRVRLHTGVHVGTDVSTDDLANRYDAVVYAIGAPDTNALDVPGSEYASSATAFVGWCNGHPDYVDRDYDLSVERALIVGNGNVALDAARLLATGPGLLKCPYLASRARTALQNSTIRDITVIGRRGPAHAAFTLPELTELAEHPDFSLRVDPAEIELDQGTAEQEAKGQLPHNVQRKLNLLREVATRPGRGASRQIWLRFLRSPTALRGNQADLVRNKIHHSNGSIEADETTDVEIWHGGLVLSSVGHRVRAMPGLPFDHVRGIIPSSAGRVTGAPAAYVVGWAKRGPTGFIGTNKHCAQETVRSIIEDHNSGKLV